jgi:hypothetical protein
MIEGDPIFLFSGYFFSARKKLAKDGEQPLVSGKLASTDSISHASSEGVAEVLLDSFPKIELRTAESEFDSSCLSFSRASASEPCFRRNEQKASSNFRSTPSDAMRHSHIVFALLIYTSILNVMLYKQIE